MIELATILLAKDDGGGIEIISLLVFAAIAILSGVAQHFAKQRQERERKAQQEQRLKVQKAIQDSQAGEAKQQQAQDKPVRLPPAAQAGRPVRLQAGEVRVPRPGQQMRPAPPAPPAPAQLAPTRLLLRAAQPTPSGQGAAEAPRQQALRQRRQDEQRRRRMETRKPPEADTADIESRLVHIRTPAGQTQSDQIGPVELLAGLNLDQPDALRRAIIYHEVFSAPKALRQEQEMWEA